MLIGGYQKLTLIDYPGKLATTVFTVGCSFRCPFCHNPELIELEAYNTHPATEVEFIDFLKRRIGKLEGVCITGGEPLVQPDIIDFIKTLKKMGYLVKLDTNGTRPDILRKIINEGIVDYIAMDIKNSPKGYDTASGVKSDIERIRLSIDMIMGSGIDYEFRTTVVPGIHTLADFDEIAKWISGAKKYFLQEYREIKILDPNLKKKTKGRSIDLQKIKKKISNNFGEMGIR